ncbi:MAG TPA: hypothetical protein VMT86_16360 [Bryobacteraceae bacterium]|nr:hypothetical protein [Bryobacteraceae bacterium]
MQKLRKNAKVATSALERKLDKMLTHIDADEFTRLLNDLRAHYLPETSFEERTAARLATLACRLQACLPMETLVLREGMKKLRRSGDTHDRALTRAYLRDLEGPNLLSKLARYQTTLEAEYSQSVRILESCTRDRRRAARAAEAQLAKLQPCTSVVQ